MERQDLAKLLGKVIEDTAMTCDESDLKIVRNAVETIANKFVPGRK